MAGRGSLALTIGPEVPPRPKSALSVPFCRCRAHAARLQRWLLPAFRVMHLSYGRVTRVRATHVYMNISYRVLSVSAFSRGTFAANRLKMICAGPIRSGRTGSWRQIAHDSAVPERGDQHAAAPGEHSCLSKGAAQPASSLCVPSPRPLRVRQRCASSAVRALESESCQQFAGDAPSLLQCVHEDSVEETPIHAAERHILAEASILIYVSMSFTQSGLSATSSLNTPAPDLDQSSRVLRGRGPSSTCSSNIWNS